MRESQPQLEYMDQNLAEQYMMRAMVAFRSEVVRLQARNRGGTDTTRVDFQRNLKFDIVG